MWRWRWSVEALAGVDHADAPAPANEMHIVILPVPLQFHVPPNRIPSNSNPSLEHQLPRDTIHVPTNSNSSSSCQDTSFSSRYTSRFPTIGIGVCLNSQG